MYRPDPAGGWYVAASIVILSIVYELNEYFTSFRYLISTGLADRKSVV